MFRAGLGKIEKKKIEIPNAQLVPKVFEEQLDEFSLITKHIHGINGIDNGDGIKYRGGGDGDVETRQCLVSTATNTNTNTDNTFGKNGFKIRV